MDIYGHRYGQYWCLCKEQEKCRSAVKAELKNLHLFKSYGQNKIDSTIMAISYIFLPNFCPKLTTLQEALPIGLFFGILGTYIIGKHPELISNPNFNFYALPVQVGCKEGGKACKDLKS